MLTIETMSDSQRSLWQTFLNESLIDKIDIAMTIAEYDFEYSRLMFYHIKSEIQSLTDSHSVQQ